MAKLADLKVVIGLAASGLRKLNTDLRNVKGKFRKNFGEIASLAKGAALTIGTTLAAGLTAVIKAGMDLQRVEVGFRSITGSSEAAAAMVGRLNKFAAETPYQLENIATAARQLLAVGVSQEDLNDRLKMLGDIAASSGSQIEDIAAIFAKVQAKGKVELENLNQLAERGIPIFDELRSVTGDANMEFGAGKVKLDDFNQALANMTSEGGFANDAMLNLSETASGKLSTAIDNTMRGLAEAAEESGALQMFTDVLDGFTNTVKGLAGVTRGDMAALNEDFDNLFGQFGMVNQGNVESVISSIRDLQGEIKDVAQYTTSWSEESDELLNMFDSLESAAAMLGGQLAAGTLAPAPAEAPSVAPKETLEEFKARFEAAAKVREEQERLLELTRQQVVTDEDLIASTEGLREAYGGLAGQIEEIIIDEEELFDEEAEQRIADYTTRMQQLALVGQNAGAIFGFVSGAVDAAFDNIKDSSQGFHEHMKQMLESLLKKALSLAAAFGAISLLTGGTAGALAAVGKKSFGSFMMGGMGLAGFAAGGMVTGPTLAMVGEGSGTTLSNPEVIAPLDKLQHMIGGGNITVSGMIRGNDILISNERSLLDRNRIRGF